MLFGVNFGGPICGLKGKLLTMPNQDSQAKDRVFRSTARACDKFGERVDINPLASGTLPYLEVGIALDAVPQTPPTLGNMSPANPSCTGCANFVSSRTVLAKTGWQVPLCRKKGAVLIDTVDRLRRYPHNCGGFEPYDATLHPDREVGNFTFWPEFSDDFGSRDYGRVYRNGLKHIIDPRQYKNDREGLTPNAISRNIRAWRKIEDPEGYGAPVFLPIYDSEKMKATRPDLYALVPQIGDDEAPEDYADHGGNLYTMAVMWMKLDETPALWGSGGVGKTEFMRHMAWLMQLPFHRISVTAQTDVDEIAGKMVFENGETHFVYGQLPSAWIMPSIILIDEPNTGPDEVWQLLRPLMDNSKMLVLSQHKNERLRRHSDSFLGMAMNPNWDVLNVGTNVIGDADLSRIMHIFMTYPPESLEKEILRRKVQRNGFDITDETLAKIMKVTVDLRSHANKGTIATSWGVRHNIKVANALTFFPPVKAYRYAIGNALDPQQFEAIKASVESHF
jgi:MoxR-like ATPase